jgi:hypothetical protein
MVAPRTALPYGGGIISDQGTGPEPEALDLIHVEEKPK